MSSTRELGERFRTRPTPQPNDMSGAIQRALDEVCAIFGARDARLVWEETEEPWVMVGTRRGGEFTCREEKSDDAGSFVWEVPLSFPIVAAHGEGRVFVDAPAPDDATRLAADAAGRLIGEQLDRHLHVATAVREAAERERIRVARD